MEQQAQPVMNQTIANPIKSPAGNLVKSPVNPQPVNSPVQNTLPQPEGNSIWKKWWFWMIIAIVSIGTGAGIYFLAG